VWFASSEAGSHHGQRRGSVDFKHSMRHSAHWCSPPGVTLVGGCALALPRCVGRWSPRHLRRASRHPAPSSPRPGQPRAVVVVAPSALLRALMLGPRLVRSGPRLRARLRTAPPRTVRASPLPRHATPRRALGAALVPPWGVARRSGGAPLHVTHLRCSSSGPIGRIHHIASAGGSRWQRSTSLRSGRAAAIGHSAPLPPVGRTVHRVVAGAHALPCWSRIRGHPPPLRRLPKVPGPDASTPRAVWCVGGERDKVAHSNDRADTGRPGSWASLARVRDRRCAAHSVHFVCN
jgi:hypothetical protein